MARIIKFYGDDCQPCKMMTKVLEQLKAKHPSVEIVEQNVSDGTLGYTVTAVPTLVIQKDGVENIVTGITPMSTIERYI